MRRPIVIDRNTKMVRTGGRPPRAVLVLLLLEIGFLLVYAFADAPKWLTELLTATSADVFGRLQLWKIPTSVLIHLDTRALISNALVLWIVGSALERWWGPRRFSLFWIVTALAGTVAELCVGLALPKHTQSGAAGATAAMLIAFAVLFPSHLVFLYRLTPLKAKLASAIVAGFLVLGNLLAGAYLELVAYAGGILGAFFFLFRASRLVAEYRVARAKKKFKVVDGNKRDKRYLN
jgi:membrane associated rhomboid family serine protease